jgi:beta-galactosidase
MKKIISLFAAIFFLNTFVRSQNIKMDKLLYGVAYYDEYMPYERLDKDVQNDESRRH